MIGEAQNAVNPDGFTSILTKPQLKILVPKSDSSLNALARAVYVERNYEMIKSSRFCIVYYDETALPTTRKSGTKIALDYAVKQKKEIINLF